MTVYLESMLPTPEASAYFFERFRISEPHDAHCVGVALVAAPDVEGRSISVPMIERELARAGELGAKWRIFEDMDSARHYLHECLQAAGQALT